VTELHERRRDPVADADRRSGIDRNVVRVEPAGRHETAESSALRGVEVGEEPENGIGNRNLLIRIRVLARWPPQLPAEHRAHRLGRVASPGIERRRGHDSDRPRGHRRTHSGGRNRIEHDAGPLVRDRASCRPAPEVSAAAPTPDKRQERRNRQRPQNFPSRQTVLRLSHGLPSIFGDSPLIYRLFPMLVRSAP
jgi:hypothetical protein